MLHIYTETLVNAPAERIWEILTAFSTHSEWNPFIVQASGEAKLGERLAITLQPKPKQTFNFPPVLTAVVPDELLVWKGRLLIPGLFDGEHKFRLVNEGGKIKFIQEECFSGLLTRIMPQSM